ncbi:hypothetical protein TYRP_000076 [Tyrophagus putrescentiae]|nr:hypothetical protein TYRP_000076 [Tyrophagus putrescentiae]
MCHQEMWMPPSQSYLHFDNQKVDQFSQPEKLQAVAKKKAKPKKTIKQISTTDLEALECSYRNDFKYKSAGNCKKLGLQFGLNYTQVRRWFIKREEKDEHNRSTSNKSKRSEQPATKILPVFPTSEIKCDHAKEGMLKMPRDAYFTGTQERKIITENAIQQWRNNPNLRPPVNELYLSNISDYPLFGYRGNNYEMNL